MKTETEVLNSLEKSSRRIQFLLEKLEKASRLLGWLRICTFILGLICFIILGEFKLWFWAINFPLLALVLFIVLVKKHQSIRLLQRRCLRSLDLRRHARARLKLNWSEIPELPLEETIKNHPFEIDLDITGTVSLYRLLHCCLSSEGSARLKSWLLQCSPDLKDILKRQKQVSDLKSRLFFRESLDLAMNESAASYRQEHKSSDKSYWKSGEILEILEKLPIREVKRSLWILSGIALFTACFFMLDSASIYLNAHWKASLGLYVIYFWWRRDLVGNLFKEAQGLQYSLHQLESIFEVIEKLGPVQSPAIQELLSPLLSAEHKPSFLMRKLNKIVGASGLQGNPMIWVIANIIMPWDFYFAWRLEQIKPLLREHLPLCLDSLWELDALNSLAEFAWLHPSSVFPEMTAEMTYKGLNFKNLGHPLLPPQQKIRNSFQVKTCGEAFLITGSNMSGKSTFLKSMGVNLVLAQAGSVVDACAFKTIPMRVFTCIKVTDSVTDGLSYFYAEVKRLKALLEAIEQESEVSQEDLPPVFFLVDEIFKGTNNRERLIGSRSYLHALTGKNAMGGVSTHDLELVQVAEENDDLSNYHFREQIQGQKMVFDYTLRSGPCPTTNALRIMAMEGLPVDWSSGE